MFCDSSSSFKITKTDGNYIDKVKSRKYQGVKLKNWNKLILLSTRFLWDLIWLSLFRFDKSMFIVLTSIERNSPIINRLPLLGAISFQYSSNIQISDYATQKVFGENNVQNRLVNGFTSSTWWSLVSDSTPYLMLLGSGSQTYTYLITFVIIILFKAVNAASPAERNTELVNITKNLFHGRIRIPSTARPPDKARCTRCDFIWYITKTHDTFVSPCTRCNNHIILTFLLFKYTTFVRTPGFKMRIRPPYPQRVVKGD